MNATDTAAKMLEIAKTVCAAHSVTNEEMYFGELTTWTHAPTAELSCGVIYITMPCNRVVTKAQSMEVVRAATLAATMAWGDAGLLPNHRYHPVKVRKCMTWPIGFWHMGVYSATGYRRGVKVPVRTVECNAPAEVAKS
jgi:hypothetical protein